MSKRRRDSDDDNDDDESESEFELEQESEDSEEEAAADDDDSVGFHEKSSSGDRSNSAEAVKSATVGGNRKASRRMNIDHQRPRKKQRKNFAPDLSGPTSERKTSAGGYSHVESSKLLISRANKGKVPWNKGKNRNTTDRAKIAAGVRARNNAIAKKKREAYGLTEEEEAALKKRIKYVRERVRRAKIENESLQEGKRKNRLAWANVDMTIRAEEKRNLKDLESSRVDENSCDSDEEFDSTKVKSDEDENESQEDEKQSESGLAEASSDRANRAPRDFEWTAHRFDTHSYRESCPVGGPGGLVCCETCTALYTQYMLSTFNDLERQKISKIGKEVEQLEDFLTVSTRQLRETIRSTRRKPIPIRKKEPQS